MNKKDNIILGVNHMFLYPPSMVNADVHTDTLRQLADNPLVDALDCWVWASHAKEELDILRNSGKVINYNIGDRLGEKPVFPATTDPKERAYSMDILRRESDYALECGAKKIIFGSGKDVPEDRVSAVARFTDFVLEWGSYLPKDVCLCLEPTDKDIDKFFLFGDLDKTCRCVQSMQDANQNIGILLDMGHIPLMYETLESAVSKSASYLKHIHLGTCVLKNKEDPLYGDKHPAWGYPEAEYDENDGEHLLYLLKEVDYIGGKQAPTISFEMRPLIGMDAEQSLAYLTSWFSDALRNLYPDC